VDAIKKRPLFVLRWLPMDPTRKTAKLASARSRRDRFAARVSELLAKSKGTKSQVKKVDIEVPASPDAPTPVAVKIKFRQRRCGNCNVLYQPVRKNQKFCTKNKGQCRKEFHRYGSSYGPLKTGLEKTIDKKCAGLRAQVAEQLRIAADVITKLEARISRIEQLCEGVQKQEAYQREFSPANVERSERRAKQNAR
jgi:hypothetical protein